VAVDSGFNEQAVYGTVIDDTCYATGDFTISGSTTLNRLAKISRGGQWRAFGTGLSGLGFAITKYKNEIYVGGSFATANGVTCNSFAKWNGTTFIPFGTGAKNHSGGLGTIFCFAVYNNELYIGGDGIDTLGGIPGHNLFKYDGTTITALGTEISRGTGGAVIDMKVDSTYNLLWIVGQFSRFNGKVAYCGVVYNGSTFIALPFQDMRPEGIVIANNQTANIRYFFMGDQMSVYGVNAQNIFELIPTVTR